jgi:hypothetical protein
VTEQFGTKQNKTVWNRTKQFGTEQNRILLVLLAAPARKFGTEQNRTESYQFCYLMNCISQEARTRAFGTEQNPI